MEVRRDDQYPHARACPDGWQLGCRPHDRAWVQHVSVECPAMLHRPSEAVPAGFDTCTAVFFDLVLGDGEPPARWFEPEDPDPWASVRHIVDYGIDAHPFAADQSFDPHLGQVLVDVLGISGDGLHTCGYFLGTRAYTATGTGLAALLTEHQTRPTSAWREPPDLFSPHHRRWFALAPYDAGWIYVAGSYDLADTLRAHPALTTLPCTA